jgi:branched-chain amino acid transport system ATP-binding protein
VRSVSDGPVSDPGSASAGADDGAGSAADAAAAGAPSSNGAGRVLLEAQSVSIRFGGIQALDDVSLCVNEGEILGLVGPNGAGKTTMFNCLCGQARPTRGTVWFHGVCIDGLPVFKRARLGMGRTFQRLEVFPEMTAREHVLVAERARRGDGRLWKDLINLGGPKKSELEGSDTILELVGLADVADQPVAALSLGHCRLVEIARAIATRPRLLMADEPSSGLDVQETLALSHVLRRIQSEYGTAVLLVEHDLDMVSQLVDRVHVLDFGHTIAEGSLEDVMNDPAVRRAYLGKTA